MRLYKHTQTPGVYMPGELSKADEDIVDRMNYNAAISYAAHSGRNNKLESLTSNPNASGVSPELMSFAQQNQGLGKEDFLAKGKKAGFTLIELLVVVAIIAILAGMLLPALSGARNRAKTVTCASNQHQIYLATRLYADDFNDALPIGSMDGTSIPPTASADSRMYYAGISPANLGILYATSYIKDPNVLWCPHPGPKGWFKDDPVFGMPAWGVSTVRGSYVPRNNSGITYTNLTKLLQYDKDNIAIFMDNNFTLPGNRYNHLVKYVVITYGKSGNAKIVADPNQSSYGGGSPDQAFDWADKQGQ